MILAAIVLGALAVIVVLLLIGSISEGEWLFPLGLICGATMAVLALRLLGLSGCWSWA